MSPDEKKAHKKKTSEPARIQTIPGPERQCRSWDTKQIICFCI